MAGYYSFIAFAPQPVGIEEPLILLDKGRNCFTAVTDDLEGLVSRLGREGVTVQQINRLDGLEPVEPEDALLPHNFSRGNEEGRDLGRLLDLERLSLHEQDS